MARQVGPQARKPEHSRAPKARDRDEDVLGEFHQGPQASACMTRPDIRLQPVPRWVITSKSAWQTGRCPY